MKRFLSFIFSCSVSAFAQDISFTSLKLKGNACPPGEAGVSFSADYKKIVVLFGGAAAAETGPMLKTRATKGCTLEVGINVPAGLHLSRVRNDFRGFIDLPSTHTTGLVVQSMGWVKAPRKKFRFFFGDRGQLRFRGPMQDIVEVTQHASFYNFKDCTEEDLILKIDLRWNVVSPRKEQTLFTFDSSDVAAEAFDFSSSIIAAPCI